MKQKALKILVTDENNEVLFQKEPCSPDHVIPTIALFDKVGTTITIEVYEFELVKTND